eukprot:CAMPEP_0172838060 /NCGR_PEP_ID=MMETSP1075-20121228/27612_1 /TAXON_ID=2916 /ORGANISM="Ceratium fusus, Strain PA161109" /LENGTH=182 /DNA_ID=CAMNT_0013681521 /DNA_START=101 /DNA_END=650 /DNA_ORIENTATION=-
MYTQSTIDLKASGMIADLQPRHVIVFELPGFGVSVALPGALGFGVLLSVTLRRKIPDPDAMEGLSSNLLNQVANGHIPHVKILHTSKSKWKRLSHSAMATNMQRRSEMIKEIVDANTSGRDLPRRDTCGICCGVATMPIVDSFFCERKCFRKSCQMTRTSDMLSHGSMSICVDPLSSGGSTE